MKPFLQPLGVALVCLLCATTACRRSTIPTALSDREYWALVESLSEPAGAFPLSDNLVSNEPRLAERVRVLRRADAGVYVGVGPEQNFSYIARLRPSIAFIVDIRRENRNLHLLYKALFEISSNRGEFVARLFSRSCGAGIGHSTEVDDLFARCGSAARSPELHADTMGLVQRQLVERHAFNLAPSDLEGIDRALTAFLNDGPDIHFWGKRQVDSAHPSYRQLMTEHDYTGQSRSYLTDEDGFSAVKDLHSRNLIVPLVGDFAGPLTLRGIGDYARAHGESIRAFYGSNVGVYLTIEKTRAFCATLVTLPVSGTAVYIENNGVRPFAAKVKDCPARPTVPWKRQPPGSTPAKILAPPLSS